MVRYKQEQLQYVAIIMVFVLQDWKSHRVSSYINTGLSTFRDVSIILKQISGHCVVMKLKIVVQFLEGRGAILVSTC